MSTGDLPYFPVSILERDGQHMGVVTKALENQVPPSSMMRRVLFITCIEPAHRDPLQNDPGPVETALMARCERKVDFKQGGSQTCRNNTDPNKNNEILFVQCVK